MWPLRRPAGINLPATRSFEPESGKKARPMGTIPPSGRLRGNSACSSTDKRERSALRQPQEGKFAPQGGALANAGNTTTMSRAIHTCVSLWMVTQANWRRPAVPSNISPWSGGFNSSNNVFRSESDEKSHPALGMWACVLEPRDDRVRGGWCGTG